MRWVEEATKRRKIEGCFPSFLKISRLLDYWEIQEYFFNLSEWWQRKWLHRMVWEVLWETWRRFYPPTTVSSCQIGRSGCSRCLTPSRVYLIGFITGPMLERQSAWSDSPVAPRGGHSEEAYVWCVYSTAWNASYDLQSAQQTSPWVHCRCTAILRTSSARGNNRKLPPPPTPQRTPESTVSPYLGRQQR